MPSFILRNINPELWARVQAKAAAEGVPIKAVILRLLAQWVGVVALGAMCVHVTACAYHAPDAPTRVTPPVVADTVPHALTLNTVVGVGVNGGHSVVTAKV